MDTLNKAYFSAPIRTLDDAATQTMLSKAGYNSLKQLFPPNLNLTKNPDLVGFVCNIAQAGRANRNGDAITNEDGLRIAKNFLYKKIDANHKVNRIIGTIIAVGFSEYPNSEVITEEKVASIKGPFNLSIAGVLYKDVLSNQFIDLLEESLDADDETYNFVKASWECWWKFYEVAVGPSRYVSEARILTDKKEIDKYSEYLQVNKGPGKYKDEYVFRILRGGDELLPAGIAVVEQPAAAYTELVPITQEDIEENQNDSKKIVNSNENTIEVVKTIDTLVKTDASNKPEVIIDEQKLDGIITDDTKNSEDKDKNRVNISENNNKSNTNTFMALKITKVEDINEENLKLAVASDITNFISEEIKKANEQWKVKVEEKENLRKDLETKNAAIAADLDNTKKEVTKLTETLSDLQKAEAQRLATEKYNQRLAAIDNDYEISAEERKVIAKNIQGLDDEKFNSYFEDLKIIFAAKKKGAKKPAKDEETGEPADDETAEGECATDKKAKKAKASVENVEDVVDDGTKNANKDALPPNTQDLDQKSYKTRFAKAFELGDGIEIVHGRKTVKFE